MSENGKVEMPDSGSTPAPGNNTVPTIQHRNPAPIAGPDGQGFDGLGYPVSDSRNDYDGLSWGGGGGGNSFLFP